jgi:hypothetical protein
MNSPSHMTFPSTSPSGTSIEVPWERAYANHLQTPHFPTIPACESSPESDPALEHRQVKRIAVRFASRLPHSAQNPGVRAPSARKSLILNPEIKTHTA